MRAARVAIFLFSLLACAQERSVVVRVEQPDGAPYPHLFLSSKGHSGTVESVASLHGTPLYVAIVIEGGKDREFGPSLATRYAKWFMQDLDLKGMMVAYAPTGMASGISNDYPGLLKNIAALKPRRGAEDYVAEALHYACRALGNQQRGQNVRRIVLLITDPSPFDVIAPSEPKKLLQIAQDAEVVLVIEDHTRFQGIAGFSMQELQETTPGLVLRGDYSHGEPASSVSFDEQTKRLARTLDQLYRVTFRPPPGQRDSGMSVGAYEAGADVYPQTLAPFLRRSYWFFTRIRFPKGVTQFGPYTKFSLRFDAGYGRLESLVSLKHAPLYVALVVQGGGDPIFDKDLPARYVKWFAENPDLRGMLVEFARDERKKGPPPTLLVRDRTGARMTNHYQSVLEQISSYDSAQSLNSFDTALHLAMDQLADQGVGENVRRVLVVISHSHSYDGPSFDPMETLQLANDSQVVIVAEDHSWTDAPNFAPPFWNWPGGPWGWTSWAGAQWGPWRGGPWAGNWGPWTSMAMPWSGGLAAAGVSKGVNCYFFCSMSPVATGALSLAPGRFNGWGRFLSIVSDATPGVVFRGASHSQFDWDRAESFREKTKKLSTMLDELYRFKVVVLPSEDEFVQLHLVTTGSFLKITPNAFSLSIDRRWEGDTKKISPSQPPYPAAGP